MCRAIYDNKYWKKMEGRQEKDEGEHKDSGWDSGGKKGRWKIILNLIISSLENESFTKL